MQERKKVPPEVKRNPLYQRRIMMIWKIIGEKSSKVQLGMKLDLLLMNKKINKNCL